jgi:hypothetical protein
MIKIKYGSFLLLCTAMLLPAFAAAQEGEERSYVAVRTVTTTTSGVATWVAQQVKMSEARKAAGSGARHVWQEVQGNPETFHIVTFPDQIGGGGGGDGGGQGGVLGDAQEEWQAATGPSIASRATMILRNYPDLTIPGGFENQFIILRYTDVAPGRNNDFQAWLGDKLVPARKAGGAARNRYSPVIYGGDTNRWIASSRISGPAALNEPGPLAGLSGEERGALFEGWGDMVWGSEVRILRFRADLSNEAPEEE